jgi:pilus assembly protein FimV
LAVNETVHIRFKKRAAALAVASCLSIFPWFAEAAGLGKITVLSGIGQPLRAELDIGATKDELPGMTARLAPQDVFRQAGVDFASVLLDLRFTVEKRPNGQSVVKVSSAKPINEPFLDFLVELNWPAGRLVREYTFLLDPPEMTAQQSSRPVAEARIVETVRGGGAVAEARPSAAPKTTPRPAPAPKAAEPKEKPESTGTRVVRQGETLRKIAAENQYEGVSLEQMLVGLFQNNPDAFIAHNVNRLKAGAILSVPEKSVVEAVSPAEAKKVYVAQARDWNDYRQKLAATTAKAPAVDGAATQASAGKIIAKVEEKAPPVEQGKDQVKVARTDGAAKGTATGKAAEVADQVAKEKALNEAQGRLQTLEKNVNDLQKLLEVKNQKLAELQQPPAKKDEPKVAVAAKPAEAPKPVEVAKPPEVKAVEPPKPVEPPKVEEPPKAPEAVKPVEPPKPVEPTKPVEAPKPEMPKVAAPPAPPEPSEPSFVDTLLDDPLPLVGGGGILALLAGYFLVSRRRNKNASVETTVLPVPSSLGPNSVFRMTGGQSIDTGNTPPQTGEFSQTGPGTIDTDEVDPVAEADVYMAYGRDTQAEEILLEALQKDSQRTAIHAKLLEIYANRRSVKQFETLAGELYAQTAGIGPDWAKVAALGQALDPNNPLYSAAHAQGLPEIAPVVPADVPVDLPVTLPDSLASLPDAEPEVEIVPTENAVSSGFERDTLVLSKEPEPQADDNAEAETVDLGSDALTLDFDLGAESAAEEASAAATVETPVAAPVDTYTDTVVVGGADALDFDLGVEVAPAPVAEASNDEGLNLDFGAAKPVPEEDHPVSTPDFSPEGTMVMPHAADEMDVGIGTWIGGEDPQALIADISGRDFPQAATPDHEDDARMTQTVVNQQAGTEALMGSDMLNFGADGDEAKLAETVFNTGAVDTDSLEFDVKLTDSMFLGQPMGSQEFDIGSINLDLSAPPEIAPAEAPPAGESPVAEAPVHSEQWEEVNTKLDLAKAYEEMGDLEGARELLQEVLGEGSVDLVEQARTILGRIGG